jgi:hypothetical protein
MGRIVAGRTGCGGLPPPALRAAWLAHEGARGVQGGKPPWERQTGRDIETRGPNRSRGGASCRLRKIPMPRGALLPLARRLIGCRVIPKTAAKYLFWRGQRALAGWSRRALNSLSHRYGDIAAQDRFVGYRQAETLLTRVEVAAYIRTWESNRPSTQPDNGDDTIQNSPPYHLRLHSKREQPCAFTVYRPGAVLVGDSQSLERPNVPPGGHAQRATALSRDVCVPLGRGLVLLGQLLFLGDQRDDRGLCCWWRWSPASPRRSSSRSARSKRACTRS